MNEKYSRNFIIFSIACFVRMQLARINYIRQSILEKNPALYNIYIETV